VRRFIGENSQINLNITRTLRKPTAGRDLF